MSESRIPLLIDTDPGVDDALALLMAFASPAHEVVALTVTAGNVGLQHTLRNALVLCDVVGSATPVHAGAASPLLHPAQDAGDVHGSDGFGGATLPPPSRAAEAEHAALAILRLSHAHAGRLQLVALGPLTNLALALSLDPTLPSRLARCVVMGGALAAHGNITPSAEFNIAFDPEAAHIVFSGFPMLELVDWEATLAHALPLPAFEQWLAADDPRARFYAAISAHNRARAEDRVDGRWPSADALAMAHALEPDATQAMDARPVVVETGGTHARGTTLVDWRRQTGRADNARLLRAHDPARFHARLRAALGAGPA
jgi:purine nucleosidase